MKLKKPALSISMALLCFLSFATNDFTFAQDENAESWLGGIGSLEKDQLNWSTATLTQESDGLEVDGSDINGRLTTAWLVELLS